MRIEPINHMGYIERGSPKEVNQGSNNPSTSIRFTIHKDTGKLLIKVIDEETSKVIREIPPEKILEVAKVLREVSRKLGILVDERR